MALSEKSMKVIGEYPDTLFRAFDRIDYAQQFLKGFVRFGTVMGYRKIEDKNRRDATEGVGHFTTKGINTKIQFYSNVFYALCCHRDLSSALETNHGKYIVEIANPLHLAEELTRSLRELKSKHFGGIEGVVVEYNKGNERNEELDSYQKSRLAYCQKPVEYDSENEFRFVFCRKEFAGNDLLIQLPQFINGAVHDYT